MATPTKTVSAPKVHPLIIGGIYGLVAAIISTVGVALNHNATNNNPNGLIGFVVTILLPIIGLFLSGHYAGRHQRLNFPESSMTGGFRGVLSGLGAGFASGLVYIIADLLLQKVGPLNVSTNGFVNFLEATAGIVLYPIFGLILGTFGGIFGDSTAHKQLKSGATVAK
jgi:hypothetical protein